jgi:hypothetical protein
MIKHKTKEVATEFIAHLQYLLSLTDRQRRNKPEWYSMIALLEAAGHWKRKYKRKEFP